ncbi:MAG TPA: SMI1/KNR4 family protein [Thermoanaerobaculia bacterium]|jgi:hypothetical protein|nr:SMI1/KNR4 family protein [Thermoanaerobaculia bacterium]
MSDEPIDLEALKSAWGKMRALHRVPSGASPKALAEAERRLGVPLPPALRALYRATDGPSLFHGNLVVYPAGGSHEITLGRAAEVFRERGWPVPDEVVVFGDDGAGSLFGVWTGDVADSRFPSPVVEIVESEAEAALGLAASSLVRFLLFQTVLGALQAGGGEEMLDALGVPPSLRDMDPGDLDLDRLRQWADPDLPREVSDPYLAGLTAEELQSLLSGEPPERASPTVH